MTNAQINSKMASKSGRFEGALDFVGRDGNVNVCIFCGHEYSLDDLSMDEVWDHLDSIEIGGACLNGACDYCATDNVESFPTENHEKLKEALQQALDDYYLKEKFYHSSVMVLDALRLRTGESPDSDCLMDCLCDITRAATYSNRFKDSLVELGILDILVTKMSESGHTRQFYRSAAVTLGFLILEDCCTHRPYTFEYARELVDKKAIESVESMMARYPDDLDFQLCCVGNFTMMLSAIPPSKRINVVERVLIAIWRALKCSFSIDSKYTPILFVVAYDAIYLCLVTEEAPVYVVNQIAFLYFNGIRKFHDHEDTKKVCIELVMDLFPPAMAKKMIARKELEYLEWDCQCCPAA